MSSTSDSRFMLPLAGLVGLWGLCCLVSVLGFHHRWGTYPDAIDMVLAKTIVAPFALPKSFSEVVGMTSPTSARGTMAAMVCFWPIVGVLAGLVFFRRSKTSFALLAAISITASIKWQVVATGMLGL